MDQEKYERTDLEMILFRTADVITTSGFDPIDYEEDELPFVPSN